MGTLTWKELRDPEIAQAVEALRLDTLRLVIWITGIAYLAWHLLDPFLDPSLQGSFSAMGRHWLLFVIVALNLGGSYVLERRRSRLAVWYFLVTGVLAVTAIVALLQVPDAVLLYCLIVLTAVVLRNPITGVVISALIVVLLLLLRQMEVVPGPHEQLIGLTVLGLALTVVVGAALGQDMIIAVQWSLESFAKASSHAEEAQRHRGQLVQTLQQLDDAYYRLRQANAALEMAWKAADAAERSKSEFVTNISHELRTPLNLIVGFSEMIVTSPESYGVMLPAEYRGDLNAIYRSAQHLLTLTDDVLDLARIGVGRLALAREPVDLNEAISDAAAMVREYVAAKRLYLHVEMSPDLPALSIDRLRIRQVLLNLLTNAARFTEQGGITITIQARELDVVVRVTDTGPGISPLDLPRVFDEFRQGEETASLHQTRGKGFGLGLPISKRLVELHGGQMGVESRYGAGASFWFTLPLAPVVNASAAERVRSTDRGWLASRGERLLMLAGGGEELARVFERHLRGYRVVATADLATAITQAEALHALAVLADAEEPEGALPRGLTPVLRVPLPHTDRLAAQMGVAAYLTKPIRRQTLLATIARLTAPVHRVLVVDDDPRFVRLIRRFLRGTEAGSYAVVSAQTLAEAHEIVRAAPPDLILLDLILPDGTGDNLLATLKSKPALAHMPVVIVSAQEQASSRSTIGYVLSVQKPEGFQLEETFRTVEALLQAVEPPRQQLSPAPAKRTVYSDASASSASPGDSRPSATDESDRKSGIN